LQIFQWIAFKHLKPKLGAVHKVRPHKIDLPCLQNVRTGSTPHVRAGTP